MQKKAVMITVCTSRTFLDPQVMTTTSNDNNKDNFITFFAGRQAH